MKFSVKYRQFLPDRFRGSELRFKIAYSLYRVQPFARAKYIILKHKCNVSTQARSYSVKIHPDICSSKIETIRFRKIQNSDNLNIDLIMILESLLKSNQYRSMINPGRALRLTSTISTANPMI